MVYVKVENGEIKETGSIFKLLPNVSRPQALSEDELKAKGVYKAISDTTPLESWQYVDNTSYMYDSVNDVVNEVKTIVDKSLDKFKETKKAEIKSTRNQIAKEGFTCSNGLKLDCDAENIDDFANAKQMLDITGQTELKIRDYYNVTHVVTSTDFQTMVLELGGHFKKILEDKWLLQEKVDACTTHADVNNIWWRRAVYDENDEFVSWEYNSLVSERV